MITKLLILFVTLSLVSGCSRSQEDSSLSTEAQLLSSYLQAATCFALQASKEEKSKVLAGRISTHRHDSTAQLEDVTKDQIYTQISAEDFLYELLPKKCPESARRIVFWSKQMDDQTIDVFENHFFELTSLVVMAQSSPHDELRKYYEVEYTLIGRPTPQY